jgi:hypothetical protein
MLPSQVVAWGQEGHSIVAEIAQRRLDAATFAKIQRVLASGVNNPVVSLSSIASWADDCRARWHFVNIRDDHFTYDPNADCKNGACVVDAIGRFKWILADCSKPAADRLQALKFLVHFVGDIHRPLHAADRWGTHTVWGVVRTINEERRLSDPTAGIARQMGVWFDGKPAALSLLEAPVATGDVGKCGSSNEEGKAK